MTQTNQNKDYSWLDPIFLQYHAELNQGLNELAGHGTALEQAKAAIQQHIDEHYIGKGEAKPPKSVELELRISFLRQWLNEDRITEPGRMVTNEQIHHWLDVGIESEVEQRCIEARIEVIEWLEADLKRLDSRNWSMDTLALDTLVGSGKADDYQKGKRDEIVTDRRAAHALYAILNNYKQQLSTNNKDTLERSE